MIVQFNQKKIFEFELFDIVMAFAVIVNVSFNDNQLLLASSQILFFMWALLRVFLRHELIHQDQMKLILRIVGFFALGIVSNIWAINHKAVNDYTISIGQIILLTFGLIIYFREKKAYQKFLMFFIVAAVVLSIRLLTTTSLSVVYTIGVHLGEEFGYDRAHIGMICAYAALFVVYFSDIFHKKWLLALSVYLMFISAVSGSRKGMIICFVGILVYYLSSRGSFSKKLRTVSVIAIVLVAFYFIITRVPFLEYAIGSRIRNALNFLTTGSGDSSGMTRSILIKEAIEVILDNPIIGVGLFNFKYYSSQNLCAHNNYFEVMCDLGIIGLLVYYVLPVKTLIKAWRNKVLYTQESLGALFFATIICLIFCDFIVVSFAMEYVQMIYVAAMYYFLNEICGINTNDELE